MPLQNLKAHWRLLLVVLALVAAFLAGRYSARKPDVKVVTHTVTQQVETKTTQATTEHAQDEVKHEVKTIVVYRDRISHPDGTVEDKSETKETDGLTSQDLQTTDQQVKVDDRKLRVEKDDSTVTVSTPRDNWHVSLFAGSPISLNPDLLVGASVERRILGPFYVGAWVMVAPTERTLGPAGGVSLGVSF